ncbi:glycosyltransferase [Arthrobacter ipis]|uniref:glycosyltransferase n=1 Tax=Arthrobacter ipis TaxID=2716202 RepID=UPI001687F8E5|nr:glycosyltransferase [Arthrobacter ipis]
MNRTQSALRVAVTKGTLRIPPTYFAVSHAEALGAKHHFECFVLAADIQDPTISTPVRQYAPFPSIGFRRRELVMPAFMPWMTAGILRFRPDVIHQHTAVWSLPAVTASRFARIPMLTTLHGADVFVYGRSTSSLMERWHHSNISACNRTSTRLLAVSRFLADTAISSGYPANKLEVHYQGIDTDYFVPLEDEGHPDQLPTVLFVGSLAERKGVLDLALASKELLKTVPHRLVFIGDGPLRGDLEKIIVDHADAEIVGAAGRSAVRARMQAASVVVVPSKEHKGWREAAGLVSLEAQACGTPVVATDSGGIGEMLRNGETGLLVSEGNIGQLSSAIGQILTMSGEEYRKCRARARDFVVTSRSLAVSCDELESHYIDLAGS